MTPFKGTNTITSPFGPRTNPIYGTQEQHKGEDITTTGAWPGPAWEVRECTGGKVLRVTSDQWRGKYVDVETAPGVFERYQHMNEIYVQAGQALPQGTVLGMAGRTGDSTGVHLHFEVQRNGIAINPEQWSDVPNAKGSYPGNDDLDGQTEPEPPVSAGRYMLAGPMSAGDENTLKVQVQALGIPVTMLDSPDMGGTVTDEAIIEARLIAANSRALANNAEVLAAKLEGKDA